MADYTKMTADELETAKHEFEEVRAGAKAEMMKIQKCQDALQARADLAKLPPSQLAALKQMVAADGVASGESVGSIGG